MAGNDSAARPGGQAADVPGWDGAPRGAVGIHGVPRARRWDTVVSARAPGLRGDSIHFVALAGGDLVVEEDEPEPAVARLRDRVGPAAALPYRAEAIRRQGDDWSVAVSAVEVVREPGLAGEAAELVSSRDGRALHVDGRPAFVATPALDRAGEAEGSEYVVRATRLRGELWEVEATAL